MELVETKYKIKCEMGACKNKSDVTVKMSRAGIRSSIHICNSCLNELYGLIGERLVPKSIETAKKAKDKNLKLYAGE